MKELKTQFMQNMRNAYILVIGVFLNIIIPQSILISLDSPILVDLGYLYLSGASVFILAVLRKLYSSSFELVTIQKEKNTAHLGLLISVVSTAVIIIGLLTSYPINKEVMVLARRLLIFIDITLLVSLFDVLKVIMTMNKSK